MITKKGYKEEVTNIDDDNIVFYGWACRCPNDNIVIFNDASKPSRNSAGGWSGNRILYEGPTHDKEFEFLKKSSDPVLVTLMVKVHKL